MPDQFQWPVKTREIHNHHMNSEQWNGFAFRDDDIILATYAKSGTTWMQQVLCQLIFNGQEGIETSKLSPWYDLRIMPPEALGAVEHQAHRRFLKTHLPVDALVFSPKAKYIYVGRDGRDMVWSLHNHHLNANEHWYGALNDTPGRVGPPIVPPPEAPEEYFSDWLERDGYPFWSFWENVRSWWNARSLPNVKLMHFNDMKRDLDGSIRSVAAFLGMTIDEAAFPKIVEHCTFDYMKDHAETVTPLGGMLWQGGAKTFINKGTNGRWRDRLPSDVSAAYEQRARSELGAECAAWLADGESRKQA